MVRMSVSAQGGRPSDWASYHLIIAFFFVVLIVGYLYHMKRGSRR